MSKGTGIVERLRALFRQTEPNKRDSQEMLEAHHRLIEAKKAVALAIIEKSRLWQQNAAESKAAKTWGAPRGGRATCRRRRTRPSGPGLGLGLTPPGSCSISSSMHSSRADT